MTIRAIAAKDVEEVIGMMEIFYASPAVHTDGSAEIFQRDVEACIGDNPYLEGYVFERAGKLLGYGMLAKSFSTEFGKPCVWIEDIYLKDGYRGQGLGGAFLQFVAEKYPDAVLRLEAEEENESAVKAYRKGGYEKLPYVEMIKFPK